METQNNNNNNNNNNGTTMEHTIIIILAHLHEREDKILIKKVHTLHYQMEEFVLPNYFYQKIITQINIIIIVIV